jgi:hypothetical protein
LLIWLGKSLLPVAMTAAPPSFASSGKISGVGFAQANTIASFAMLLTMSTLTILGAETPMNTSAPFIASASEPWRFSRLVICAISSLIQFMPSLRPS